MGYILSPPPSVSKLYWQCRVYAKPRHFHFHHLSNTRPDPHSTRPRELATDSRGAGSEGPFDQYVTRQTSKPVIMGRTIISPGTDGDRAARVRLTTGQARTCVLGMTFRPGPSPLGGPRPSSTKDGGERGPHPEKILARTRGKGTTPGFEGQAGSYIVAQKRTVGAVTSRQSLRAVTPGQSLRGSHFGTVASLQSPDSSRL